MSDSGNGNGNGNDTVYVPQVGDVIDGRYRIEAIHAIGGMGRVYRATHLMLAREVALKIASSDVVGIPGVSTRFLREARVATQLENRHIAQVFDIGVLTDGTPYLVMEWLEGKDLSQVLMRTGPLSAETAVEYILQTCEALAEAHGRGIVHRDLKPSNLLLARGEDRAVRVKLLDFGVAKVDCGSVNDPRITQSGMVLGSPAYMAPEQAGNADRADERADIWGLGVVLYELITNDVPFGRGALTNILSNILLGPRPKATKIDAKLPPGLDEVIVKCLQMDAEKRYRNVGELAEALAPFAGPGAHERAKMIAEMRKKAQLRPLDARISAVNEQIGRFGTLDSSRLIQLNREQLSDSFEPITKSLLRDAATVAERRAKPARTHFKAIFAAAAVMVGFAMPAGIARVATENAAAASTTTTTTAQVTPAAADIIPDGSPDVNVPPPDAGAGTPERNLVDTFTP